MMALPIEYLASVSTDLAMNEASVRIDCRSPSRYSYCSMMERSSWGKKAGGTRESHRPERCKQNEQAGRVAWLED